MSAKKTTPEVIIKKVHAFPFKLDFKSETLSFIGYVVKLTQQGFLFETEVNSLKPGMKFTSIFELPLIHQIIETETIVVKIYNHYPATLVHPSGQKNINLIEMHFKLLTKDQNDHIYEFLKLVQKSHRNPESH